MFETKIKNRLLTPRELEWEGWVAKAFKRPKRYYLHDKPIYPYCVPEPVVNFDLGYPRK